MQRILPPFMALASPSCRLLARLGEAPDASLPPSAVGQLLDVVHHAVEVPLGVELVAPTQLEAAEFLVVPDVAKHRLHGADALAVEFATLV